MAGDASVLATLLLLAVPFAAALLCMCFPPTSRRAPWLTAMVALALCILLAVIAMLSRRHLPCTVFKSATPLAVLELKLDPLGLVLILVTLINGLAILMFSLDYLSPSNREHGVSTGFPRYYSLFLVFVASMIGVAMSADLLLFSLFYELTGICSCLLIGYYRERRHTFNGYKALVLTHVGGLSLIVASVLVYTYAHTFSFSGLKLLASTPKAYTAVGLLLLVAGLAKSAQVPFHIWLPDAMVAPTTVSAYLHAASMVNVGVFTLLRYAEYAVPLHSKATGLLLMLASLTTMFFAVVMYYAQRDIKRLLAYSTISQLAYMMLAISFTLLTQSRLGVEAAVYHLWNHSFAKALLFLTAGSIAYGFGSKELRMLHGLARRRGWGFVAAAWAAGALAIVGVPPFNCFYSKLLIILAGLGGDTLTSIAAILAVVESILAFIVFSSTIASLLAEPESAIEPEARPPRLMLLALMLLLVLVVCSQHIYTLIPGRGGEAWRLL